jgi:D-alanyl-D-alanine endopeptidase (penicillin-binding protein 7)
MIFRLPIILSSFLFCICASATSVTAQAWLIADENGKILEGNHTTEVRSIASITKLMTVMVVLDSGQPLLEVVPKKLYKKQFTRLELINLALVHSDNNAARILCEFYHGGLSSCVRAMNDKALTLGMYRSEFTEPTGLYDTNVSTAEDLIKLVQAASYYVAINKASNTGVLSIPMNKKKIATFNNTNTLVGKGTEFIVSKTGWIRKSGGCIVMMLKTTNGIRTVIVLGSKNTKTRIPEAHMLANLY